MARLDSALVKISSRLTKPNVFERVTLHEESRAAYDRVGLTSFLHRHAEQLMLARLDWYQQDGIELHIGIDLENNGVTFTRAVEIAFNKVIMATGSYPFVPPIPRVLQQVVFVDRTIEELQRIIEYSDRTL